MARSGRTRRTNGVHPQLLPELPPRREVTLLTHRRMIPTAARGLIQLA